MTFRHWATKPVRLDRQRKYESPRDDRWSLLRKPSGLWFDVDEQWREFAQSVGIHQRFAHILTFKDTARLLRLQSVASLHRFETRYGRSLEVRAPDFNVVVIDWERVAAEYDGIIIAPYQWRFRFRHEWYMTWDVASGCVWNLDAVASFEREIRKERRRGPG